MRSSILMTMVASATLVAGAKDGELLNGGFEKVDSDGHVIDWAYSDQDFTVDPSGGCNGTRALKYSGSRASMILQRVRVRPGMKYNVGVWIRPQGLEGDGFCARVCVLFEDQYGQAKDGNGFYSTPHIKGTKPWTLCSGGPAIVPKDAFWATVRVEVVPPCRGTVWFDDVFFTPYSTKPVEDLYTSAYRDEQAGGKVRVVAGLNDVFVATPPEKSRGTFTVRKPDGTECTSASARVTRESAEATLDVERFPIGKSTIEFRLADTSGKVIGTASREFTRTETERRRRVTFDRLGRTIVDGKPFFPLGMYWSVSKPYHKYQLPKINEETMAAFAKGPFNCVMPYATPNREQMDLIHSHGIKVIRAIINTFRGKDWDPTGKDAARRYPPSAVRDIAEFKDHPALLAWYLNDEEPLSNIVNLKGRLRTIRELDPDHPSWVVLYQWNSIREYMDTFDVVGTDPYPVPTSPLSTAWMWSDATRTGTMNLKPRWQVPQVFDWAIFRKTHPEDRMPTREEMRSMAWQNIAGGANGLIFYSYTYLMKSPTTPFEKGWADVRAVAGEVRKHFDILLAGDEPPKFKVSGNGLAARTWRQGGDAWILCVNTEEKSAKGSVSLAAPFDDPEVAMGDGFKGAKGKTLNFEMPPVGVAIVRVEMKD